MSAPDSNFYAMGKSIGWVIPDEKEACETIIGDVAGITPDQSASFLAGHRAARTEYEDGRVRRAQFDAAHTAQ